MTVLMTFNSGSLNYMFMSATVNAKKLLWLYMSVFAKENSI